LVVPQEEAKCYWEEGLTDITKHTAAFFIVIAVAALLVALPALSRAHVWPQTETFTELYVLGSNQTAEDYPFNLSSGRGYSITLGLGNHLGYCAYYLIEVKFRNESQSAPTSFGSVENRLPSSLRSLYNVTAFVADASVWQLPVSFGFDYGYNDSLLRVDFHSLTFNGNVLSLKEESTTWNATTNRFYGDLVFELWRFNSSSNGFRYDGNFVDLKLNMTVT
jgi:hypothetical protein